jgi:hypothetical protein
LITTSHDARNVYLCRAADGDWGFPNLSVPIHEPQH